MKKTPLADLKAFLGSVFHAKWTDEHESAEHAIRKFARRADEKTRKSVIGDIHRLSTEYKDEDLENFVCEDCKGDIFPPALGFTYANWLKHTAELIASTPMNRRVDPADRKAASKKAAAKKAAAQKAPAKKAAPVKKKK
jgi:hypothetical protein